MSEICSFRAVVELWGAEDAPGGRIALASEVPGASATQVSKWWQRDFIPPEYWPALTSTDKARESGVTADVLARLAAARKLVSADVVEARA